jgi:DNA-binding CsgD family transcriptional regulator
MQNFSNYDDRVKRLQERHLQVAAAFRAMAAIADGPDCDHKRGKPLTKRELEVALLVADGHCIKGIADQLGIAPYTVKNHRRVIHDKLSIGMLRELCVVVDGPIPEGSTFQGLSVKQNEVARLLFTDKNTQDIIDELDITEYTLKDYKEKIRVKLGIKGKTGEEGNAALLLKRLREVLIAPAEEPSTLALV